MDELRLPSAIENSQCVLVAGAGGGFDVYAGLPMYEPLRSLGKTVFLANLSFVPLGTTSAEALTRALYAVEPTTTAGQDLYFPERTLAQFLSRRGKNVRIYAFERLGVTPIREGYAHLACIIHQRRIVSRTVVGSEGESRRRDRLGLGKARECSKRPERLVCDKAPPADAESE